MSLEEQVFLWNEFQKGSKLAFQQLVYHFNRLLIAYTFKKTGDLELSKDLVQEAWLKIYKKEGELSNVRAFMFTVVNNLITDLFRKKMNGKVTDNIQNVTISLRPSVEDEAEKNHVKQRLKAILQKEEYEIWELHEQGYKSEEISERLSIHKKTIDNKKSIIKAKLKEAWK